MPVQIRIPAPLRPLAGGQDSVAVEGGTVREALEALESAFGGLKPRLRDDSGQLRRFVNVYLASEDIRHLEGLDTTVRDGDVLSIVPAVAGGLRGAHDAELH